MIIDSVTVGEYRKQLVSQVAIDDTQTECACCGHRVRNDSKGMTRWQAMGLKAFYDWDKVSPGKPVHASSLFQRVAPEAARDHGVSLLRHWGLLQEVERPEDAIKGQKGSRGVSGFYKITPLGRAFVEGKITVHKNIVKVFGQEKWEPAGRYINFQQALSARLITNENEMVINGTTSI